MHWGRHRRWEEDSKLAGHILAAGEDRCLQSEQDRLPGWRVAVVAEEAQVQDSFRGRCSCWEGGAKSRLAEADDGAVSVMDDGEDMALVGREDDERRERSVKRSSPSLHSD